MTETSSSDLGQAPAKSPTDVTCAQGNDSRSVKIKTRDDGGCDVMYTKFGVEKSVASGGKGSTHCQKVSEKITSQLTKSGFRCE